jgi:hypothetical protein
MMPLWCSFLLYQYVRSIVAKRIEQKGSSLHHAQWITLKTLATNSYQQNRIVTSDNALLAFALSATNRLHI